MTRTDSRITKSLDGVYTLARGVSLIRDGRVWHVSNQVQRQTYRTFRVARLAALLLAEEATDAEAEAFSRSWKESH